MEELPSILECRSRQQLWLQRDPGNLTQRLKSAPPQPECHCPTPSKGMIGGQDPAIDLDRRVVVCRTCARDVPTDNRRRAVTHLRSLLSHDPSHVDWDVCSNAGWLL